MWEQRADRTRRAVADLAVTGLGLTDLHQEAMRLVGAHVGSELTCWAAIDPATLVISSMVSGDARVPPEFETWLAEAEYSTSEPHTFASLARSQRIVARSAEMPSHDRAHSLRHNNVWRPLGIDAELRVLCMIDGACWAAAGMVRSGAGFNDREAEFLTAVAPAIAAATRVAVRTEASRGTRSDPPAIAIVGPTGDLRSATPAGRLWQDRLEATAPGRFHLIMAIMALGTRTAPSRDFHARVRDGEGNWVALSASPLVGQEDNQVAVTIEAESGDQLMELLIRAYGLTLREDTICREVMAGHPTGAIAAHLSISPSTVQDHLKSIFAKVDVRSRGELVARLRPTGATKGTTDEEGAHQPRVARA